MMQESPSSFVLVSLYVRSRQRLSFVGRVAAGMLRNSIVQEGDTQVTIPYGLYREALLWIRRTHRSLTVDEWSLGKPHYDIPKDRLEGHLGRAQ
jgi:hypothetical protein